VGRVDKKTILVNAPDGIDTDIQTWNAAYRVTAGADAIQIDIEARGSAIEVVVAKIVQQNGFAPDGQYTNYYISSPNYGVAIPSIPTLGETWWIMEKLIEADMPAPDAVTVSKVLAEIGDF